MNTSREMIGTAATRLKSKSVIAVCVLVLIQVYRISAYSFAQAALTGAGGVAAPWFFPAAADVLFGITAPLMAFVLWRMTGLGVWVAGIVWLALSFFDFVDGLMTAIAFGPPGNAALSIAATIAWFLAWLVVDLIALTLLTRKSRRFHYLQAA